MSTRYINPEGLYKPDTYWQAAISEGTRLIHVSGQVAWDEAGQTVGIGDLAAQTECAYSNIARAVNALGADFGDIVKLNVYVVDWSLDKRPAYRDGRDRAASALGVEFRTPITLVGVTALAEPDLLIEIEAVAVIGPD